MSRIGKKPVIILPGVEAKVNGNDIEIKGPKGVLSIKVAPEMNVELKDKEIIITPKVEDLKSKALWGLMRSLVNNMVDGVVKGFEKKLEINGVGFKASVEGKKLVLNVGYSHPIYIEAPEGIEFKVEKNVIAISGINKELVGQIAADDKEGQATGTIQGKGNQIYR